MSAQEPNSQMMQVAEEYLQQLRRGPFEAAFHNLTELGPDILPALTAAFDHESSPEIRRDLLRVISALRVPATMGTFGSALLDRRPQVWRTALDGLVMLGSPQAAALLAQAITNESQKAKPDREFIAWVREAHEQMNDAHV